MRTPRTRHCLLARDVEGHLREKNVQTATEMLHHRLQPCPYLPHHRRHGSKRFFADFFEYGGRHYLVVGDRLSGWVEVLSSTAGTNLGGSSGLVRHLRSFFATFGVPEELSSDGGPEFIAGETENFLRLWGVRHGLSSAGFSQSNGRAEVAVKTAKRLLMSNTGPTGRLDHDRFLHAMLQLRNTPDPDCNLSPAQIIFGCPLRDTLSFVNELEKFSNPHIRPLWRQAWAAKEEALRTRLTRTTESMTSYSRPLRPLTIGERVFIQNQRGTHPTKWDRSGTVVESPGYDQYRVKVDGSGRLTLRNRRFLRAYTPATSSIPQPSPAQSLPAGTVEQKSQPCPPSPPTRPLEAPQPSVTAPRVTPPDVPSPTDVPSPHITQGATPSDDPLTQPPPNTSSPSGTSTDTSPPAASTQPPPMLDQSLRPCRVRRPPKRFEPETGKWLAT